MYSDLDNTFIYPNSSKIAVGTLSKSEKSLLTVKNDEVEVPKNDVEKEDDKKGSKKEKETKKEIEPTLIDIDGFESRVEMLDVAPGNLGDLKAVEDKLLFMRLPNSGSPEGVEQSLDYYDFKEREVKTIIPNVTNFEVSAHINSK